MDIASLEWNQENLDLFGVNQNWLPTIVKNSSDDFGRVAASECSELADVPITGVLGD